MAKAKTAYVCADCGAEHTKWQGQCVECGAWNTLSEFVLQPASKSVAAARTGGYAGAANGVARVTPLTEVLVTAESRTLTGMGELDRVLGGGLVEGSVVLIGGDPGIGKSTLLLQMLGKLGEKLPSVYVTGEESLAQVAARAQRLDLPLQPLHVAFGGDAEIRTLKGAEWIGGQVMPTGDALLSGYYLNELLLRLLARDDAHPQLFDAYAASVAVLASEHGEAIEPALRTFELLLLREIGLLPALDTETLTLSRLDPDVRYGLVPESGLVALDEEDDRPALHGWRWVALQRALDDPAPFHATLREAARDMAELKPLLRSLLHYHCGVGQLRTRQMLIDLQSL